MTGPFSFFYSTTAKDNSMKLKFKKYGETYKAGFSHKTITIKKEPRPFGWLYEVKQGDRLLGGGSCRTLESAQQDSCEIFFQGA